MRFLGIGNGTAAYDLSSHTRIGSSCSGTAGATALTATNVSFTAGQRVFIHQTRGGANVGKGEDNQIASYTAGTITLVHPMENTYTDSGAEQAQVIVVPEVGSTTGTLSMIAWDGDQGGLFVIAVNGIPTGTINGNEKGYIGGSANSGTGGNQGEGSVGAGSKSRSANGNGGGGGQRSTDLGGSFNDDIGAGAGSGANATDGNDGGNHLLNNQTSNGVAGSEVGDATLATIFPGGAGGAGGADSIHTAGKGGNGGAIVITYAQTIPSTLTVNLNGGDGIAGGADHVGGSAPGAGGSFLAKCVKWEDPTINVVPGAGQQGCVSGHQNDSFIASVGRIRVETCSSDGVANSSTPPSESEGGQDYCGGSAFII